MNRYQITAMAVSAATLVGIAGYEGYSSTAYVPVKGDVPTIGWGTTAGVKKGISRCVKVPLSEGELDAYLRLTYNIGQKKFCSSALVKKLNRKDYKGACTEIRRWCYFKNKKHPGLVNRREKEYRICMKGQE